MKQIEIIQHDFKTELNSQTHSLSQAVQYCLNYQILRVLTIINYKYLQQITLTF